MLKIAVKTPASIANLGSGFDCLALAVDLRNEYVLWADIDWALPPDQDEFTFPAAFSGKYGREGNRAFGGPDNNRFLSAFVSTRSFLCRATGYEVPRCRCFIEQIVDIPPARGLGSSSSAAVAGAAAALKFFSTVYPEVGPSELLERYKPHLVGAARTEAVLASLAMREDRCCDNVCASTSGGLTVAFSSGRAGDLPPLSYFRNEVTDPDLRAVVLIPHRQMLTRDARQVSSRGRHTTDEAVFNLQRTAAWPLALEARRYNELAELARDRLHQEDRMRELYRVAPDGEQYLDLDRVFAEAVDAGAYCAFVAGAGSSIAALAPAAAEDAVSAALETSFGQVAQHASAWDIDRVVSLKIVNDGYQVLVDEAVGTPDSLKDWMQDARGAPKRPLQKGVATPPGYLTFHSYNSYDRSLNEELNRMLLAEGFPIWFDDLLQGGDKWRAVIASAVGNSRSLMLCVGPEGLGAYQIEELELALRLRRGVVPVLLFGAPRPSSLPTSLSESHAIIIKTKRPTRDDVRRIIAALHDVSVRVGF